MSIYDCLPYVNRCCFCISLKFGSALIAILGILRVGASVGLQFLPLCRDGSGTAGDVAQYVGYVVAGVDGILCIFSIVFLIGICIDRYITAILLLHAMMLFLVVNIAYVIFSILFAIADKDCRQCFLLPVFFICIFVWIYFMIIIRSYKDGMA